MSSLDDRVEELDVKVNHLENALIDLCIKNKGEAITGVDLLRVLKDYRVVVR